MSLEAARSVGGHPRGRRLPCREAITERDARIAGADLVISMLAFRTWTWPKSPSTPGAVITPSYVSPEMKAWTRCATSWRVGAERTGADPDRLHECDAGHRRHSRTRRHHDRVCLYCGGLVAPASTTIPGTTSSLVSRTWCWQDRCSGRLEQGRPVVLHIAPSKVWCPSKWKDAYDGYPNRDSLSY